MTNNFERSVWGTSTDDFKLHFREYLRDLVSLADDNKEDRVALINKLEWCFERWNHWREKFFAETASPMLFPFFQSATRGNELGHYSTMGASGQPSVIHIKRAFLMGTSDIKVWKSSDFELVLLKDHPDRMKYVDQTILHELVHQFLYEGADEKRRLEYRTAEAGRSRYRGHGTLFAAECNRINETLHPEMGFEFVPVRHNKRDRGFVNHRQRPSCAQFTHGELFFAWDPSTPGGLTAEQEEENRLRMEQALAYFNCAVVVRKVERLPDTEFLAPFDSSCADVCIDQLTAFDKANGTDLVASFIRRITEGFPAPAVSIAYSDICPAGYLKVESKPSPVVPANGDALKEWQQAVVDLHAVDLELGATVHTVIDAHFDNQKPPRNARFNGFVAETYGVTTEAVRLWVKKAVESAQVAA